MNYKRNTTENQDPLVETAIKCYANGLEVNKVNIKAIDVTLDYISIDGSLGNAIFYKKYLLRKQESELMEDLL